MKRFLSVLMATIMAVSFIPFSQCKGTGILSDTLGFVSSAIYITTPKVSSVSNGVEGVIVKWNGVFVAKSYNVYRKTAKSDWKKVGNTEDTTFVDNTGVSGTTYTYTVRACRGSSMSGYDATGKSICYVATPIIKKLENVKDGIKISWDAVKAANSYTVYRKTSDSWESIGTTKSTSFTDKKVSGGTIYYYTLRATVGKAKSAYDDGVDICRLTNPVLSSATNSSKGIVVKWGAVKGANGYNVYRKTTGNWSRIGTSLTTSYTDKNISKNVTYTYTVRACYGDVMSSFDSKGKSVKANTTVSTGDDKRAIKWYIDPSGNITTEGDKGVLGFGYSTSDKCFYATGNSWQRNFGYSTLYDQVSELVVISYDTIKVFFTYADKDWMIQLWKGQYGFVLEGGEVGVYNRPHDKTNLTTYYECANDNDRLPIALTLYDNGVKRFSRKAQTSWWMTGFVLGTLGYGVGVTSEYTQRLTETTTITFKDEQMRNAFVEGLKSVNNILNNAEFAEDASNGKLFPGERSYSFKAGDGVSATKTNGTYKVKGNSVTLTWR